MGDGVTRKPGSQGETNDGGDTQGGEGEAEEEERMAYENREEKEVVKKSREEKKVKERSIGGKCNQTERKKEVVEIHRVHGGGGTRGHGRKA